MPAFSDGLYVDVGAGYIEDNPVTTETSISFFNLPPINFETTQSLPVENYFPFLSIGYEYKNYHFELSRAGELDDSKNSITYFVVYRRFYLTD